MATLARRQSSTDRLRAGLLAMTITGEEEERRDAIVIQSLLWRSAEVLGLDPAAEFRRVAHEVGDETGLVAFSNRTPRERSIAVMAYVEGDDPELGFRYQRTW